MPLIGITAANGKLGTAVIHHLLARNIPSSNIVAMAREVSKLSEQAAKGVIVRHADYEQPDTLFKSFKDIDTLLVISSPAIGRMFLQHKNAVDAAKKAGVKYILYTSVLNAPTRQTDLSKEHKETEAYIISSGIPYTFIRCGWYIENWVYGLFLKNKEIRGCAKEGLWSAVTINDLGEGTASVLLEDPKKRKEAYEFAGDEAFTHSELAAEISKAAGVEVPYIDMNKKEFIETFEKTGLPSFFGEHFAQYHESSIRGEVFNDSKDLSKAMGHPTANWREFVRKEIEFLSKQ